MIGYGRQSISGHDVRMVARTLRSDFLTQGPQVERFEASLAERVNAKYCVAVSSATAGLHIAVALLGLGSGDEGITSPVTFVATPNSIAYAGAQPRFADVDANSVNLSVEAVRAAISPRTKLLIPVHFTGRAADMPGFAELASRHDLAVIEDAAHAVGSRYWTGEPVGSCTYSDMTVFSFHPVKTITTAEGGAITTNDRELYERLKMLRSHGITRQPEYLKSEAKPWYYEMHELGFNYRLSDVQAALGVSQLGRLDKFIKRRREIVSLYRAELDGATNVQLLPADDDDLSCYHLFVIRIPFYRLSLDRETFMGRLRDEGIGTQVHYIPVHTQPYYKERYGFTEGQFPEAERYYREAVSIPLHPSLSNRQVRRISATIRRVLE